MASHDINIQTPNGSINTTLPDYALDKTSNDMLKQLEAIAKDNKSLNDAFTKLINSTNQHARNGQAQQADIIRTLRNANDARQQGSAPGGVDSYEARFTSAMSKAGTVLGAFGTGVIMVTGAVWALSASLVSTFTDLSDNIYELQQVGVGLDTVNGTVIDTIQGFQKLGVSSDQAVQMMREFSRSTAIVGRNRLPAVAKEFLKITNQGMSLGLTLEQASEGLMEEIENRSRAMNISNLSDTQLAKSASDQIALQTKYAAALGISVDKLRDSSAAMMEGNFNVAATLAKFPDSYHALNAFVTTSTAMMGEGSKELITGMLDSATGVGAWSTEAAKSMSYLTGIKPIGQLQDKMNRLTANGQLKTAEAGEQFANELHSMLSSLSKNEIDQLHVLSNANAAGAEAARSVLLAHASMLASKRKMEEFAKAMGDLNVNDVRNKMIRLDNARNQISGTLSNILLSIQMSLLPGVEVFVSVLEKIAKAVGNEATGKSISEGFTAISNAVMGLLGSLFNISGGADALTNSLTTTLPDTIKNVAEAITKWINEITAKIKLYTGKDGNIKWGEMIAATLGPVVSELGGKFIEGAWNAAKIMLSDVSTWKILGTVIGGVLAVSILKSVLSKIPGMGGDTAVGGGFKASAGTALQIVAIAGAMLMLANALKIISEIDEAKISDSLEVMALGMIALGTATFLAGKMASLGIVGLLGLSAVILSIGYAFSMATPALVVIGDTINKVGTTVANIIETVAGALGSVATTIASVWSGSATMDAGVRAVKDLEGIPNANIIATSKAISELAKSMEQFNGSSSFMGVIKNALGGLEADAFSKLDHAGINRSASAISRLALALGNFAGLDGVGIRNVSAAVDAMAQSNTRATAAYDQFSRLDASAINKASLAVFSMNAGNKGMLVAPQPTQGGNYLSNMARAVTGSDTNADESKKDASKTKGATGQPILPKGANKVEDLLIKILYNSSLTVRNLQQINKKTAT